MRSHWPFFFKPFLLPRKQLSTYEMDLEEWELLPHDRFIDYHEDGEKKTFGASKRGSPNPKTMFNMNYFMCPSSPPKHSRGVVPNQLVPVPIELEPATTIMDVLEDHVISKKDVISVVPIDLNTVVPSATMAEVKEADQDSVSQVFFKKMKENEFVDMKLDSPKSSNTKGTGFVPPQIDAGSTFNFDEKNDHQGYLGDQVLENTKITSPRIKITENEKSAKEEVNWEEDGGGLNLWKLSLTGIGAICTFGVAAATICIFIFGSQQRNRHHQQNQKLSFQIYTDDKRIKQVVHHATKLNEAIAAARGVPIARAHITYGGYYDGL
ncbi:hypothetical protein OIU85_003605 [Salix viminalis]|uniref:DUF6821 domain-containing protein n=1 Tax=Salix viminalis TaxID=40686 RepID=A0A9Q0PZX7_SALVM|nr:hypothetical protein OIU85_003605 [Salix viminalis]